MFRLRFSDSALPARQQRREQAVFVLSSALVLALLREGWSIHCAVGEPVTLTHGKQILHPFAAIQKLASEEWSATHWSELALPAAALA